MSNGLPRIWSYGEYSSSNYGAHCLAVDVGPVRVWFSYRTPVAFQVDGHSRVVRQNDWGPVTGKHLRWIDGHLSRDKDNGRVDGETFERLWKEQVEPRLNGEELQPVADPDSPWSLGLLE